MSGSFGFEGGQLVIRKDARVVLSTQGTLMQFLTNNVSFSANLVFPDVTKVEIYAWSWQVTYSLSAPVDQRYSYGATGQSLVGARPQEWTNTVVLGSVPSGADDFMGRASFNRTVSPSHDWWGNPINPLIPSNVPVQIAGSFLLEQQFGFARAATIMIVGGNLVAFLQQSVGPGAGNFISWGEGDSVPTGQSSVGGENTSAGGRSIPVFANTSSPQVRTVSGATGSPNVGPGNAQTAVRQVRNGGSNEATYNDPTNYGSTYALNVSLRWGRRS